LNNPHYDRLLNEQVNPYTTEHLNDHGFDERGEGVEVHPCLELRKLLSSGTFYYSSDFDLTRRLQKRFDICPDSERTNSDNLQNHRR
jgi:hypothetical protein